MATLQAKPAKRGSSSRPQGPRRIRVSIRKVSPWSVLKFSLIFYFCLMLVVLFGVALLLTMLEAAGVLDPVESFLGELWTGFNINVGGLLRTLFLIGFITVVVGSAFTVFVAFLYNLISDLVGGIELTLVERR